MTGPRAELAGEGPARVSGPGRRARLPPTTRVPEEPPGPIHTAGRSRPLRGQSSVARRSWRN